MKDYNVKMNVGKAKYLVSFHDGIKTHKDNSPFYDITILKSKKSLNDFTNGLILRGYSTK